MSQTYRPVQIENTTDVLEGIRHEMRVVVWLFRITVLLAVYSLSVPLLTPNTVSGLAYSMPGYILTGLFLFVTVLHYITGVWGPRRELRRSAR